MSSMSAQTRDILSCFVYQARPPAWTRQLSALWSQGFQPALSDRTSLAASSLPVRRLARLSQRQASRQNGTLELECQSRWFRRLASTRESQRASPDSSSAANAPLGFLPAETSSRLPISDQLDPTRVCRLRAPRHYWRSVGTMCGTNRHRSHTLTHPYASSTSWRILEGEPSSMCNRSASCPRPLPHDRIQLHWSKSLPGVMPQRQVKCSPRLGIRERAHR